MATTGMERRRLSSWCRRRRAGHPPALACGPGDVRGPPAGSGRPVVVLATATDDGSGPPGRGSRSTPASSRPRRGNVGAARAVAPRIVDRRAMGSTGCTGATTDADSRGAGLWLLRMTALDAAMVLGVARAPAWRHYLAEGGPSRPLRLITGRSAYTTSTAPTWVSSPTHRGGGRFAHGPTARMLSLFIASRRRACVFTATPSGCGDLPTGAMAVHRLGPPNDLRELLVLGAQAAPLVGRMIGGQVGRWSAAGDWISAAGVGRDRAAMARLAELTQVYVGLLLIRRGDHRRRCDPRRVAGPRPQARSAVGGLGRRIERGGTEGSR